MTADDGLTRAKRSLRAAMQTELRAMTAHDRDALSAAACAAIARMPWFLSARAVFAFVSLPHEIDTAPLLRAILAAGKQLVVPRVVPATGRLEAVAVADLGDLRPGVLGVREPSTGTAVAFSTLDVALVPGLAFDSAGGRLGRGAGYYDRCLAEPGVLLTCGLAFARQVVARVPMQPLDCRMQWLATEHGVTRCTSDG